MSRTAQIVLACRSLELPDDYEPVTKISVLMSNVGLAEIITCLRSSEDGNAMLICAYYDRLNPSLQKVVTIDHLIAAARCRDILKIGGIICDTFSKSKAIQSQMIAAESSPDVMKAAVKHAKGKNGFQHNKMVQQIVGVAPMPVNQKNILIGNRIDNSKTQVNIVDSHDRVVDEVSAILGRLPGVPQPSHSAEDKGHRGSQEDKTG